MVLFWDLNVYTCTSYVLAALALHGGKACK